MRLYGEGTRMISQLHSGYGPNPTDIIQVILLQNIDCAIVGADLRTYYLGKRGDTVKLPVPNAMRLVSQNIVALCSN
jgi:hypothetical protein